MMSKYQNLEICRRATRGRGGGGLPCPILKIEKRCPDFVKKCPDYVHTSVKFSIQNVILKVSRRKNSRIFPCGVFFSGVFDKIFPKVP